MSKFIDVKRPLFAILVSFFFALGFSSGHFSNPDPHLRLTQSFSLSAGNGYVIPEGVGDPSHGNIAIGKNEERYSVYAPGQIVLFAPLATVANSHFPVEGLHPHYVAEILASFVGPFLHFLTAYLIYRVAHLFGHNARESMLLGMIYAFGVMSLASSRDGYEHTYEAFFLLGSTYSAWLGFYKRGSGLCFLASGLLLGIGALFRPNVLIALPALLLIAREVRPILLIGIGLFPCVGLILAYNEMRFGSLFETGYPSAWQAANPEINHSFDFSWQHLKTALPGLLISPGKGLFVFSPILFSLLLFGVSSVVRRPERYMPLLYICLTYICLYAPNFAWHGSLWSWGPRYLIPTIPFLVLAIPVNGLSFKKMKIFYGLAFTSFVVQFFSIATNYKRHLIEIWNRNPDLFDGSELIFQARLSPILGSIGSFANAANHLLSDATLYTFFQTNGWADEARPATLKMMLDASIDLNAIDLWWVRIVYFPINDTLKVSAFVLGSSATVITLLLLKKIARGDRHC